MTVGHVGVREFRGRATGLLEEAEPIAVEWHGKVIWFYIPVESKSMPDGIKYLTPAGTMISPKEYEERASG